MGNYMLHMFTTFNSGDAGNAAARATSARALAATRSACPP